MVAQNGMPLDETVQTFVGPHWGAVTPFALDPPPDGRPALDPGPPPAPRRSRRPTQAFKEAAVEVIGYSAVLDPDAGDDHRHRPRVHGQRAAGYLRRLGATIGIRSPASPTSANVVALGDYGRVVAEFWADGPSSETPPGPLEHPRQLRHRRPGRRPAASAARARPSIRWSGTSSSTWRSTARMHDAAVAAWGSKRFYDYTRPISMIRYMGGLGQSSDPDGVAFHPDGLPLEPGLVEVITERVQRPRRAARGAGRPRRRDRRSLVAGHAGRPRVRGRRGRLDPRRRLGALPAVDVRDPGVRRLHLGPQHVQPRRRRGAHGDDRQRVLPRRAGGVDRARPARWSSRPARTRTSRSSGPPTPTPPTRRGSPGSTAASTSGPTTCAVGSSGPRPGRGAWDARPAILRRNDRRREVTTMDGNPVIDMLGRRLRLAVIGGGPGSFIGAMHRTAARLDDRYELVAGGALVGPRAVPAGRRRAGSRPRPQLRQRGGADRGRGGTRRRRRRGRGDDAQRLAPHAGAGRAGPRLRPDHRQAADQHARRGARGARSGGVDRSGLLPDPQLHRAIRWSGRPGPWWRRASSVRSGWSRSSTSRGARPSRIRSAPATSGRGDTTRCAADRRW